MPRKRSWTDEQLMLAVAGSESVRSVIIKLRLVPAGGNYDQINDRIKALNLSTSHFTGMGWNVGLKFVPNPKLPLNEILVKGRRHQSNSLKLRLFNAGLREPKCELCGWCEMSVDGRIPIELDHINGDHMDNRIENLRILCPNCHSLQLTHRGKNKKTALKYKNVPKLV
jgi:5-methylcytosine-specific restriction endonuclease McrA